MITSYSEYLVLGVGKVCIQPSRLSTPRRKRHQLQWRWQRQRGLRDLRAIQEVCLSSYLEILSLTILKHDDKPRPNVTHHSKRPLKPSIQRLRSQPTLSPSLH